MNADFGCDISMNIYKERSHNHEQMLRERSVSVGKRPEIGTASGQCCSLKAVVRSIDEIMSTILEPGELSGNRRRGGERE